MELICKAMQTENENFLNVVMSDNEMRYALTDDELEDDTFKMPSIRMDFEDENEIKGLYKHFKDKNYEVLGIAHDSECNKYVFYKALYETDIKFYLRPYDMFFSKVDKEKYPDVSQEYRFEKMN